jgi:hypothetical protein
VSFHPAGAPPADVARQLDRHNVVVVTTKRGLAHKLADVHLVADSVVGLRSVESGDRVAIAVEDVRSIAVGERDTEANIFLVGTLVVGTMLAVAALLALVPYSGT